MTLDRSLSACIVDDEELARRGIRSRLSHHDDVDVVAECESGREAVEALRTNDLDLVFLDVQMPGLDGFDVIDAVGVDAMPVTIFVTAYDEHALRAFDVHALDYLLKPLDEERFAEAVDHARTRIAEQHAGEFENKPAGLLSGLDEVDQPTPEEDPTDRFVVKSGGRVRFVKSEAIQWVGTAGDYVQLHTADQKHLLRKTMIGDGGTARRRSVPLHPPLNHRQRGLPAGDAALRFERGVCRCARRRYGAKAEPNVPGGGGLVFRWDSLASMGLLGVECSR